MKSPGFIEAETHRENREMQPAQSSYEPGKAPPRTSTAETKKREMRSSPEQS